MKSTIRKIAIAIGVLLCGMVLSVQAQIPSGANYVCEGGTVDVGAPVDGTSWQVRFSSTQTDTPMDIVTMDGNTFPTTNGTGYYYLYSINTDNCESIPQEIPIYVLAPLTVAIAGDDYCVEDVESALLTATVTANDPEVDDYVYQWYTVDGSGTETAIPTETNNTYAPTETTPGDFTYKVRAGYLIDGNKYCSNTSDITITVLPIPTTPTITIGSTAETDW